MKNRRHIALGLTAILLASAAAMPANAKPAKWKHQPQKVQSQRIDTRFAPSPQTLPRWAQRKISASEAKSIARKRAGGGEVVDISRNGNTYRVRVIRKDGRVVDVLIDATTGRVK
ncbi:PepSY domain-containing protein [Hellea sp.]|nr:PepSY domain-containing protein [Hellea sp.]MDB2438384.1 PepSY domain-containing protein [Hellea sp.]